MYSIWFRQCIFVVAAVVVLDGYAARAVDSNFEPSPSPQVEIYIPSVQALAQAAKRSNTAKLCAAISGLVKLPDDGIADEFDATALLSLLGTIGGWPNTSIGVSTFTQDRDGRPRWAVRVDWPIEELVERVRGLLQEDAGAKLLKEITLRKDDDGDWVLELPDTTLAVLLPRKGGSLIVSSRGVKPPEMLFGQKQNSEEKPERSLVYCRLNLNVEDEDAKGKSPFAGLAAVSDVRYAGSVTDDGCWKERFNLRWNPLLGLAIKNAMRKTREPFAIPAQAYAAAAVNIAMFEGLADSLAGLPSGTMSGRAGTEMGVCALPGGGFLPIPDVVYQFHARGQEHILKSIREAMRNDANQRKQDDKPPAWHETNVDEQVVFWRDATVDSAGGLVPASFRTVVFCEDAGKDKDSDETTLVIIQTPTWVSDTVTRWKTARATANSATLLPRSQDASWEAVIHWKAIYSLVEPYLSVLGSVQDANILPPAEELSGALPESKLDLKIAFAGVDLRHTGPLPFGAAFLPAVTAMSLSEESDEDSEAGRERCACRNLRVLFHHAKLFEKDFGRWPANVAELDGYVDFSSHPDLLSLRPKDDGFAAGFVSMFTPNKSRVQREAGEDVIDDGLYVIEGEGSQWCLRFRNDQFKQQKTICIDAKGDIHRVGKQTEEH